MDIVKGVALCGCFIGSFYIWRRERLFVTTAIRDLKTAALNPDVYVDRNNASTIRRRVISFALVSGASAGYVLWSIFSVPIDFSQIASSAVRQICLGGKSLALTLCLFAGVILEKHTQGELLSPWEYWREEPLLFARDLVICPIGEELFFRGVLFDIMGERSQSTQVCVTSLFFALSHVHHVFSFAADAYRSAGLDQDSDEKGADPSSAQTKEDAIVTHAWRSAFLRVGAVSAITTVFGFLSGLYYLRVCHHSLLATIVAHMTCNTIGAPFFSFLRAGTCGKEERAQMRWIGIAYALGIAGFITAVLRT